MTFVRVADVTEIAAGKMKRFEAGKKEILVANVNGEFFAAADRCPHMNARLSMGLLNGRVITCPLHFSRFDVTTGKKLTGPVQRSADGGTAEVPEAQRRAAQRMTELIAVIRTNDLQRYPVQVVNGSIMVDV